ncbi:hypothetical protein G6F35_013145 [Rhizopus arrhizus]|nr:hypothetical protein G6F35_013145 [Rhizopus arrhizus]
MDTPTAAFIVNLDVPDLAAAEAFYTEAFGLRIARRLGPGAVELLGGPTPLYLLHNEAGSAATEDGDVRDYERHWTPLHLDWQRWSSRCASVTGATSRYWPIRSATASA